MLFDDILNMVRTS